MKMIKNIATTIAFLMVMSVTAQKSVVLKYNYKKGDKYVMNMTFKQNMGMLGGMTMTMKTDVAVDNVTKENFVLSNKVKRLTTNMVQGGQEIKFDSDMKEEELDATGKQMKAQLGPILKATIYNTHDFSGKILKTKAEPDFPGAEQEANQGIMSYSEFPKEAVKVGTTWTNERDVQGMKLTITYTVKEITSKFVKAAITGTANIMGMSGKISGNTTFNVATGNTDAMKMNMTSEMQGMTISMVLDASMKKVN